MTPSNDPNGKPLIYRIADALGITHLVVAVQHSHSQEEIEGLSAALAAKANAIPAGSPTGAIVIVGTSGELSRSNKTLTDLLNAIAAKQDALTFDTTPTAGSTNPVTSGGVKTSLNQKANASHTHTQIGNDNYGIIALSGDADGGYVYVSLHQTSGPDVEFFLNKTALENVFEPDTTPTMGSSKLVTSGGVASAIKSATSVLFVNGVLDLRNLEKDRLYTVIIKNNTGETAIADDFIDASLLPSGEDNVYFNTPMSIEVANGEEFGIRIIRTSSGCYGCYDGKFEY